MAEEFMYYQFMDAESDILGTVIVPEHISEEFIEQLYHQWVDLTIAGQNEPKSIELFVEWLVEVQDIDAGRLFVIPINI